MSFWADLRREIRFLVPLVRTLRRVGSIAADSPVLACDDLEAAVARFRERPALTFEGRTVTYGEFDAIANRYAHWAQEQGLRKGQTVALLTPTRIEYPAIWYGLSKVGVITALINHNLTGAALAHCLDICGATACLTDAETSPAFEAVRGELTRPMAHWSLEEPRGERRDLAKALKSASTLPPDRASAREGLTAKDLALFIFTSGTTGMPKAARITHMRAQLYMRGFAAATNAGPTDRVYNTLPLYHSTGGLCALGAALLNGGSVVLRKKFSAGAFWDEVVAEGCTLFVYIGELCRYLANQPEHPLERSHKLRMAFGNGLRPDVWRQVLDRFRVPQVLEFYGATEGNVSLFNYDGRVGACGRVPRYLQSRFNVRLVEYDVEREDVVRSGSGLCIEPGAGQIGECVGEIGGQARYAYAGYADKKASERKIIHDVAKRGDAWFGTGDLMRRDADGYFYFVDRIGDTFRWKGENVSTGEVASHLAAAPGVREANVYGVAVPGYDGRAGMAALAVDEGFDLKALRVVIETELPGYAQPLFLRLQRQIETTATFKYRKVDLVADGFDPARTREPIYFHNPSKGYVKLTQATYAKICAGEFKL